MYSNKTKDVIRMPISIRVPENEEKLIKEYAKAKNMSLSVLFRQSVLEKIEDEIDIEIAEKAWEEHQENGETITFDEALKELDIEL